MEEHMAIWNVVMLVFVTVTMGVAHAQPVSLEKLANALNVVKNAATMANASLCTMLHLILVQIEALLKPILVIVWVLSIVTGKLSIS